MMVIGDRLIVIISLYQLHGIREALCPVHFIKFDNTCRYYVNKIAQCANIIRAIAFKSFCYVVIIF